MAIQPTIMYAITLYPRGPRKVHITPWTPSGPIPPAYCGLDPQSWHLRHSNRYSAELRNLELCKRCWGGHNRRIRDEQNAAT